MYIIIKRKRIAVADISEAVAVWEQYRDSTSDGCSVVGNGVVVFNGIEPVAKISYNGRVWPIVAA